MKHRDDLPMRDDGGDASDLLREALDAATHDELPSRARLDRIESQLAVAILVDEGKRVAAPAARTSERRALTPRRHIRFAAAKIGFAALVGMGAAWSGVEGLRMYRASTEGSRVAPTEQPALAPKPAELRAAKKGAPIAREAAGPAIELAPPAEAVPAFPSSTSPTPNAADLESTVAEPAHSAPNAAAKARSAELPRRLPEVAPSKVATDDAAEIAPAASPPVEVVSSTPRLEEDLLERASRALGRDPAAALALADEHARAFVAGRLAQEREFVAIQALSALGREGDARARGSRFLSLYPHSPYTKDVQRYVKGR